MYCKIWPLYPRGPIYIFGIPRASTLIICSSSLGHMACLTLQRGSSAPWYTTKLCILVTSPLIFSNTMLQCTQCTKITISFTREVTTTDIFRQMEEHGCIFPCMDPTIYGQCSSSREPSSRLCNTSGQCQNIIRGGDQKTVPPGKKSSTFHQRHS